MSVELVIDGYNLLPFTPLGRRSYGPGDLERARDRLLKWLIERLEIPLVTRTVVVFDSATGAADQVRQHRFRGLTVCFSARHQEADEVIEHLIQQHATPQRLTVVSSDHRLVKAIRRRKGISVTSEEFANRLESRPRSRPDEVEEAEKPEDAPLDPTELQEWLEVFSSSAIEHADSPPFPEPAQSETPAPEPQPATPPEKSPEDTTPLELTAHNPHLLAELEAELQRLLSEDEDQL